MSNTASSVSSTAPNPEVNSKMPSLVLWLALGALGLLLTIGGLGWNWKTTTTQTQQQDIQRDVNTQMAAVKSWLISQQSADISSGSVPLSPVQQSLAQDAKVLGGDAGTKLQQVALMVQSWVPNEKEVADAHDAQIQLISSWQNWHQVNAALDQQPQLAVGVWANALAPLRAELIQVDPQTLTSVFAPKNELGGLQKQWSDRLMQYAGNAKQLAIRAAQDTTLSAATRQSIADWAQPLQTAAAASSTLVAALPTRVSELSWPNAFMAVSTQAGGAIDELFKGQDVKQSQWVISAGVLLLIVAALGLAFGFRQQRMALLEMEHQHMASQASRRSLDRITRQMRQVMRPDMSGEGSRSRLEESSRNPGYNLVTLINQVLDLREGVTAQITENEEKSSRLIQGMRRQVKELEQASQERLARIEETAQHHLLQAQSLAALGQQVRRCLDQATNIWEGFRNSQAAVQETTWKTEAIRNKSQSAAKRIKRVGESTQSISVSMDVIRQLGVRIQLLSFNAAIEAPLAGGTGRNLAVLVREIQNLAQNTDETVKETEMVVRDIQEDAKQAVATMEQNTEDVVEANNRATQAGVTLVGIERQSEGMVNILNRLAEALENRALDDADLAASDKNDKAAMDRMIEQAATVHEAFDTLTQSGQAGTLAVRQRLNRLPIS